MVLNAEVDELQHYVLGKEQLPSTSEVFSKVRREKSKKIVMLGFSTKNSALNTTKIEIPATITNKKNCSKRIKTKATFSVIFAISLDIQGLFVGNYMKKLQIGKMVDLETKQGEECKQQ